MNQLKKNWNLTNHDKLENEKTRKITQIVDVETTESTGIEWLGILLTIGNSNVWVNKLIFFFYKKKTKYPLSIL